MLRCDLTRISIKQNISLELSLSLISEDGGYNFLTSFVTLRWVRDTIHHHFPLPQVTESDFPDVEQFQAKLSKTDIQKFHSVKSSLLNPVLRLWKEDLPAIMKEMNEKGIYDKTTPKVTGRSLGHQALDR